MQSTVRRDLILIVVLALVVLGLVEFRFSLTTHIGVDPSSTTRLDAINPPPIKKPSIALDDGLDEYGEVAPNEQPQPASSNPSALHYSSSFVKSKHQKHRKPNTGQQGVRQMPPTTLVKHSAGEPQLALLNDLPWSLSSVFGKTAFTGRSGR